MIVLLISHFPCRRPGRRLAGPGLVEFLELRDQLTVRRVGHLDSRLEQRPLQQPLLGQQCTCLQTSGPAFTMSGISFPSMRLS